MRVGDPILRIGGEWCDITSHPDGWVWCWMGKPARLMCETPRGVRWQLDLPEWLLHLRCASMGEAVMVIGQGHESGQLLVVLDGRLLTLSQIPMFGRAVIRSIGNEWQIAVQTAAERWQLVRLNRDGTVVVTIESTLPRTSQGFLRWEGDRPVRTDDVREYRMDGQVALLYPLIAGTLVLGQHPTEKVLAGVFDGQRVRLAAMEAFEPYGVALADGSYAICSRTPTHAQLEIVRPPFEHEPVAEFIVPPLGDRLFFYFWDDPSIDLPRNATTVNLADGIGFVTDLERQPLAFFAGGGSQAELEERAAMAGPHATPVIGIADGFWPSGHTDGWPAGVDILATEIYPWPRGSHESATSIAARVRRQLATFDASRRFVLVVKQYRNPGEDYLREELPRILQEAIAIAAEDARVVGFGIFSGPARQGGIDEHPELLPLHRAVFAQIAGRPPMFLQPVPIPQPPPKEELPMKSHEQVKQEAAELVRFYDEPDGLNRAARGLPSPIVFNDPAIIDWFVLLLTQPVEDVKRQIRNHPSGEYKEQHPSDPLPPADPLLRLVARGGFWQYENGDRFTKVGTSDFKLLFHLLHGMDITPILRQRRQVLGRGWSARVFGTCDFMFRLRPADHSDYFEAVSELAKLLLDHEGFLDLCVWADAGKVYEGNTHADHVQREHWLSIGDALSSFAGCCFVSAVNENDQHSNRVVALDTLQPLPEHLCSRGSNGADTVPPRPWMTYEEMHWNDVDEWQRKVGHNTRELTVGDPNGAYLGSGVPAEASEITRADKDIARFGKERALRHISDSMAGCSLLCAGGTIHTEAGKQSVLFEGDDLEWVLAGIEGARSVQLEFQDGRYERIESNKPPDVLRIYRRVLSDGRFHEVRIRA